MAGGRKEVSGVNRNSQFATRLLLPSPFAFRLLPSLLAFPRKGCQNNPMNTLAALIKREAYRLGSDLCQIAAVEQATHSEFYRRWLGLGRAGEMAYLERNVEKRENPALLAEEGEPLRSLIVLGIDYHRFDLPPALRDDPSRGIIASYAWGDDYHEIIRPLLYELDGFIRAQTGRMTPGKGLVDTGPVLERDWAMQAGLGFTGKNCCTIHPQRGSWLFLATLLIPEALPPDPSPTPIHFPLLTAEAVAAGLPPSTNLGAWHLPNTQSPISNPLPPPVAAAPAAWTPAPPTLSSAPSI